METTINQRIDIIAEKLCGGNISELARITGINQPALRDIVGTKQSKPRFEILNTLVENSTLRIDAYWLLTGNGEMIKKDSSEEDLSTNDVKIVDNNFLLDRIEYQAVEIYKLKEEIARLKQYKMGGDMLSAAEPKI